MRNILNASLAVLLCFILVSCVIVPKKHGRPGPKKVIVASTGEGGLVVIKGPAKTIHIYKTEGFKGKHIGVTAPGVKVRVLKVRPKAVLIRLPNGKTGWVNKKWIY